VNVNPRIYQDILKRLLKYSKEHSVSREEFVTLLGFFLDLNDETRAEQFIKFLDKAEGIRNLEFFRGLYHEMKGETDKANKSFAKERVNFPDNLSGRIYQDIEKGIAFTDVMKKVESEGFKGLLNPDEISLNDYTGKGEQFYSLTGRNSVLEYEVNSPRSGDRHFYIVARGKPTLRIWPVVELLVNSKRYLIYVNSEEWRAYPVILKFREGKNKIRLRFINDGWVLGIEPKTQERKFIEDRNVYINNIWYFSGKDKSVLSKEQVRLDKRN
jgi:hypothetical protein